VPVPTKEFKYTYINLMSSVEGLVVDTSVGDVCRHLAVDVCAGGAL
jgi:hypothetical protein